MKKQKKIALATVFIGLVIAAVLSFSSNANRNGIEFEESKAHPNNSAVSNKSNLNGVEFSDSSYKENIDNSVNNIAKAPAENIQANIPEIPKITDIAKQKVQLINNNDNIEKNLFPLSGTEIINFGRTDQEFIYKLRRLAREKKGKFRIIQLGDSHTAGDYFSDAARKYLQDQLGDGGAGWFQPNRVQGQRNALIKFSGNWVSINSHNSSGDFPLGGVITYPAGGGRLNISLNDEHHESATIKIIARGDNSQDPLVIHDSLNNSFHLLAQKNKSSRWNYFSFSASTPISIQDPYNAWTVGTISIENNKSGISYGAMGINGAQITEIKKWRYAWLDDLKNTDADLVILSYGTNEAYGKNVNIASLESDWDNIVKDIKKALPNAGILIIGAPESLKGSSGSCGNRPVYLDAVQQMQQRVAQNNGILFWSWQEAMGGNCSMRSWITKGLAAKDGVHFSQAGYTTTGRIFAQSLMKFAQN